MFCGEKSFLWAIYMVAGARPRDLWPREGCDRFLSPGADPDFACFNSIFLMFYGHGNLFIYMCIYIYVYVSS